MASAAAECHLMHGCTVIYTASPLPLSTGVSIINLGDSRLEVCSAQDFTLNSRGTQVGAVPASPPTSLVTISEPSCSWIADEAENSRLPPAGPQAAGAR